MAIDLGTTDGALFPRLGAIWKAIQSANTYLANGDLASGGLKSVGVSTTDILAQYQDALQQVPDGITMKRDSVRTSLAAWKNELRTIASNTVIETAHADVTLVSKDIATALRELIKQMAGAGSVYSPDDDVDAPTVSATVTASSANTGTGVVVASVVRADGRANELVFAETIEVAVASDAGAGATARSETATVKGEVPVGDPLDQAWPAGSGGSASLFAADAALDATRNLLYNSDFESFTTTNQPDYWGSALVGTYGTTILEEATVVLRTGKSLEFVGDGGGTLSSVAQSFAATSLAVGTSGTTSTLKPNTVYAVNCWMRKSAGLLAGAMQLRLLDSSNAQTADDAATNNLVTVAHGALSSGAWTAVNGFFRTAKTVTSTTAYKLNVRVSTALTSGESVYVDDLAMVEATQVYTGGPYVALFAGATNFLVGDLFAVAIANDRAGTFQEAFDRMFGMRALGLQLPSDASGTETIPDYLATRPAATYDSTDIMARGQVVPLLRDNTAVGSAPGVDFTLFNRAMFVLMIGASDITVDAKLQEDNDSGFGSPIDIASKAITQASATDDNHVWIIELEASEMTERYARMLVTVGNGAAGSDVAVLALGLDPVTGAGTVAQDSIVDQVVT
jgi:hypothetical protein